MANKKMNLLRSIPIVFLSLYSFQSYSQQSATCLTRLERSWLNGLNQYRSEKGVDPLIYSEQLTLAGCAQIKSLTSGQGEINLSTLAPEYSGTTHPVYFIAEPDYVGVSHYIQAWETDPILNEIISNSGSLAYNAFGVCILKDQHFMYFGTEKDDLISYVDCEEKDNRKYEWIIEPKLQYVKYFETEGAIAFRENNKWGYIDTTGTVIIPAEYFGVLWFENGISCAATMEEKAIIINRKNEIILQTDFYSLMPTQFEDRLVAGYSLTGPFVLTDAKGNILTEKYEDLDITDGDYFTAIKNGKAITIDKNGKAVLTKDYKELSGPVEGYYSFSLNGKYGFMNEKFEVTIKPEYTALIYYGFANGLSHFGYADNKVGFIDYTGKKVIPNIYDEAGLFNEFGHTMVSLKGEYGILNKDGSYLIEPQYEQIKRGCKEGNWIAKSNGKFGILSNENQWIIAPEFDDIHYLNNDRYLVWYDGYWGMIRLKK